MKKKILASLLSLTMIMAMLSGCSGQSQASATAPAADSKEEAAPAESAGEKEAAAESAG